MTDQPPSYPPPPPGGYGGGYPGGYGYEPQSSYGYPPPMGGYPVQRGTNGMAIASLVCSLVGLLTCGTGSVLGLIFGFIGLNQVKSSGQEGRGMALAGIIVSAITLVLAVILVVVVILAAAADSRRHNRYRDYDYRYHGAPAAAVAVLPQKVAC